MRKKSIMVLFASLFVFMLVFLGCGTSEQSSKTAEKQIKTIFVGEGVDGTLKRFEVLGEWRNNHKLGDEIIITGDQKVHYKCTGHIIKANNLTHNVSQDLNCPLH